MGMEYNMNNCNFRLALINSVSSEGGSVSLTRISCL